MSRSYKKNPVTTNSGSSYRKFAKNKANRVIRRTKDVADGMFFKKIYSSWDICDYKCFWSKDSLWWPLWKAKMK